MDGNKLPIVEWQPDCSSAIRGVENCELDCCKGIILRPLEFDPSLGM